MTHIRDRDTPMNSGSQARQAAAVACQLPPEPCASLGGVHVQLRTWLSAVWTPVCALRARDGNERRRKAAILNWVLFLMMGQTS